MRLGFCMVRGLGEERARQMLAQRVAQPFASLDDFKERTGFNKDEIRTLAEIGALNCFAAHHRDALWQVESPVQNDLFTGASVAQVSKPAVSPTSQSAE